MCSQSERCVVPCPSARRGAEPLWPHAGSWALGFWPHAGSWGYIPAGCTKLLRSGAATAPPIVSWGEATVASCSVEATVASCSVPALQEGLGTSLSPPFRGCQSGSVLPTLRCLPSQCCSEQELSDRAWEPLTTRDQGIIFHCFLITAGQKSTDSA
ncbi:unnamed protein product [Caretta caretta]